MASATKIFSMVVVALAMVSMVFAMPQPVDPAARGPAPAEKGDLRTASSYGLGYGYGGYGYPYAYGLYGGYGYGYPYYSGYYGGYGYPFYG